MSELEKYVAELLRTRKAAANSDDPDVRGELVRRGSDQAQKIRQLVERMGKSR